jgi:hypothetical protein
MGYTTLEGFFTIPHTISTSWVPFLDVRGHIFNNGKPAANAGLGIRYLASSRVWGANAYYDYRKTSHQHYNQVSAGLESLGRVWDFRLNGYLPVGDKTSHYYDTRFSHFSGNSMYLSSKREEAFRGANAEVGAHVKKMKYANIYAAAGPYYFDFKGKNAWGGEVRLAVDLTDYVKLEGNASYDRIFKWIVQGQVSVNIPFGGKSTVKKRNSNSCSNEMMLRERALQRVDRDEIIVLDTTRKRTQAINPDTGLPYTFIFVDNTSSSLGTYESPYATLATAESNSSPYDVIYVFPGNGLMTGMDEGITLQDNQQLLGSSVAHSFVTTVGTVSVPAQTSQMPIIGNTADTVVTLANNNTISGLYIQNTAGSGIASTNSSNVTIVSNTIQGNSGTGIVLNNSSGTINILDNLIDEFADPCINISGTDMADVTYNIQDNILFGLEGTRFQLTNSSHIQATISGNIFYCDEGNNSLFFVMNNAELVAPHLVTISNNIFKAGSDAINIQPTGFVDSEFTITDNTIFSTGGSAIELIADDNSQTVIRARNNSMEAWDGVLIELNADSQANLTFRNNTLTAANVNGLTVLLEDNSGFEGDISNNTITVVPNSSSAIAIQNDSSSSDSFYTISRNTLVASNGINLSTSATTIHGVVQGNTLTPISDTGISLSTTGTGIGIWSVIGNTFDSTLIAVSANSENTSTMCLKFLSNRANPIPNAYNFTQLDTSTFNLEPNTGNLGQFTYTGTITQVPAGNCD